MSLYEIEIQGLKLFGHHGVLPEEEKIGQFFILDLRLEAQEPKEDRPDQMVDYGQVALAVERLFLEHRFLLIESLAQHILKGLEMFSKIHAISLKIAKPNPPIPLPLDHVAVTLRRDY